MPARQRRTSSRRRLRRRLYVAVSAFLCAVLVGMVGSAALAWWGTGLIQRQGVSGLSPAVDQDEPVRRVNVLVVGDDSRDGLTRQQMREFGTGDAEGNRTDSIMLVQLEVNGAGRAAALSFPRDLTVERCDGSVGRINAAYTVGVIGDGDGPSCLVETVTDLTGIPVHHYVEVSFAGFVDIVDAIGGVELYLEQPLSDDKAHIDLPAGCVRLTGADALGFVRARQIDNDFGRIARQQRFLKETMREATSLGVLANPKRLYDLVNAVAGAVTTDDELGLSEMRELAEGMRKATAEKLRVHTVPSVDQYTNGVWYVEALPQQAKSLYRAFRTGGVLDEPARPAPTPPPAITVLNATGETGLAATAAELFAAEGFEITEVADAATVDLARSRITFPPHLEQPAAELSELLDGAELLPGEPADAVVVELGLEVDGEELRAAAMAASGATEAATEPAAEATSPASGTAPSASTYRGAGDSNVDC